MSQILDNFEKEAIEKGRQEGRKEALKDVMRRLMAGGYLTGKSRDDIIKEFEITPSEYDEILKQQ